jgi:hypothetical protein
MTTHTAGDLTTATLRPKRAAGAWRSRLVLLPPLAILLRISARLIFDPTHAAASTGVSLSTPEALTDTRAVGGLALTVAAVVAAAVFSRRRLRMGHATIVVTMGSILAIRLFGFTADGTTLAMGDQKVKAAGEVTFLVLNAVAYAAQGWRSKPAEEQR